MDTDYQRELERKIARFNITTTASSIFTTTSAACSSKSANNHHNRHRLKTFKAKLVVFPRRVRKFKAGDSTPEELAIATQVVGPYMLTVCEKPTMDLVKVTEEMKLFNTYDKLHLEKTNASHVGVRAKRAAEAEKEDKK
ncbi:60S ribosomal protein L13-1-like [Salvia miltiorrhiza]|uniref:60S ribosomal protein L13-1-like n=1 Tax=Salvia miltiorrhiza TaxID=226208 RepID=UPI0025ACE889|nr:60S ribosomal protein L13-1-like [Salvia miltiorrhiza]